MSASPTIDRPDIERPEIERPEIERPEIERIVVINDLARPTGGASALAMASARALAARGHAVTYISGDAPGPAPFADSSSTRLESGAEAIESLALGHDRLLSRPRLSAFAGGLWNGAAARMVRGWIARHDTPGTVYHLHGWAQILSPAVFAALAPVRERLVLSAHDFFLACPNGAFADLRRGTVCQRTPLSPACLAAACDRQSYLHKGWRVARSAVLAWTLNPRHCPPVLAIHEGMRPFLRRAGIPDAAIHALPNPVMPFSATRIPAESNREVLFVGRLEATKGPDLAAAAAQAAGVPLRLVGDGALAGALRERYPAAILAGRLPPDRVAELARTARLLVMPSRYPEPYGLVAMEAALAGLPVVLPPTALLAADLVAAGAAVAVDPRDTSAFAAVLRRLDADDDSVRAMSEAACFATRTLASTPEGWIDALLGHYRARLVAARRAARAQAAASGSASPRSVPRAVAECGTPDDHERRSSSPIGR